MKKGKHPCDCCEKRDQCQWNNDCVFSVSLDSSCNNHECNYYYEDCCILGVSEKCGSNNNSRVEWERDEEE